MTVPVSMRAAVYKGKGRVVEEEIPVPEVGPADLLVEVSHCGICGSDLHFMVEDWAQPDTVHGHEYSGTVVAVGDSVAGIGPGDLVVGGPRPGCGHCGPCRRGDTNLCADRPSVGISHDLGAFAQYKVLAADSAFRIPESVTLRTAALTEPLAVALRGVRRAKVGEGSQVLVLGAGPIGLLTVAALRSAGIDQVTVSEPGEARREAALRVGASTAVEPSELVEPPLPMDLVANPFDAVIDASGRADAMTTGLTQLGRGGRLVLSGTGMRRPRFDPNRIILNELVITGSFEYDRTDFDQALRLLASGKLPVDDLIEEGDVTLDAVGDALERLASGAAAAKVMVSPRA